MSLPMNSHLYSLTWGDYGTSLVSAVQLLRCHGDLVDCTLAAGGRSFPAHKIVLCAASPFLLDLLKVEYSSHFFRSSIFFLCHSLFFIKFSVKDINWFGEFFYSIFAFFSKTFNCNKKLFAIVPKLFSNFFGRN